MVAGLGYGKQDVAAYDTGVTDVGACEVVDVVEGSGV